jgi:hypothetical protein
MSSASVVDAERKNAPESVLLCTIALSSPPIASVPRSMPDDMALYLWSIVESTFMINYHLLDSGKLTKKIEKSLASRFILC